MVYSVQNSETGELDYMYTDCHDIHHQKIDEETGEPLNGKVKVRYVKHKDFQIPKRLLRGTMCEEFDKEMKRNHNDEYQDETMPFGYATPKNVKKPKKHHYNKDDFLKMDGVKNEIVLAYKKKNITIFLIPSLLFFNIYFAVFVSIMEVLLHIWAHKKNGLNMDNTVYYRSPLHVLTSQFCAVCRSEHEMEINVFKMLNKQMRKARQSMALKETMKIIT